MRWNDLRAQAHTWAVELTRLTIAISSAKCEELHWKGLMSEVSLKQATVKVLNPPPGCREYMAHHHAQRLVNRGAAKFDRGGRLEFLHDSTMLKRMSQGNGSLTALREMVVEEYCGLDAMPERAVMPPSPSVLRCMRKFRGPLVPPVRSRV